MNGKSNATEKCVGRGNSCWCLCSVCVSGTQAIQPNLAHHTGKRVQRETEKFSRKVQDLIESWRRLFQWCFVRLCYPVVRARLFIQLLCLFVCCRPKESSSLFIFRRDSVTHSLRSFYSMFFFSSFACRVLFVNTWTSSHSLDRNEMGFFIWFWYDCTVKSVWAQFTQYGLDFGHSLGCTLRWPPIS